MKLTSVHICLEVADYQRAMTIHGPLLAAAGFTKAWGDGKTYTGFRHDPFTLVIGELKNRRVVRQAPIGNEFVVTDHVGFATGKRADVDAIAAAMTSAGIAPLFPAQEYPEFGTGFYAVTYCDADHNVIEFGYHPPALRKPAKTPGKRPRQPTHSQHG